VGDAVSQISATVDNVRGVLCDAGCSGDDVVQAIAYCKTAEVMRAWQDHPDKPDWPCISVITDICRDDLLFEIEATASRQSSR
jgi:enamine deaminase RidA (YjgF/YER057c/UK114 family)